MSSKSDFAEVAFGCLVVLLVVLQAIREWTGAIWVETPQIGVVLCIVALMVPRAGRTGGIFLSIAVLLTTILIAQHQQWPAILLRALLNIGFFAAFFSALSLLRYVAQTSTSMNRAGTYLAWQPPGRRYVALTLGAHVFGHILNYGALHLLGTLSVISAAKEPNESVRLIRVRRMMLAIQRGFISTIPWSPLSFTVVIVVSVIPGVSWAQVVLPGLVISGILIGVGWALDSIFKPKSPSGQRVSPATYPGQWTALRPLGFLLLILVIPSITLEIVFDVRIIGVLMFTVPAISIIWLRLQLADGSMHLERLLRFTVVELPSYKRELLLLMAASYIGTIGSTVIAPYLRASGIDLSVLPTWQLLLMLLLIMPLLGQIGANPILSASLIGPLLPPADALGITPTALAIALICGWTLSALTSPFTATTLLVARLGGIRATQVGWVWNRSYFIVITILLGVWMFLYAFIVAHE